MPARHLTLQCAWRCHLRTRHSPCRFFFLHRCSVPTLLPTASVVGFMQRLRWQWHLRARQAEGTCLPARHLTPQFAWRCHLRTRHSSCRLIFFSLLYSYLTADCPCCSPCAKTAVAVASANTAGGRYVLASSPPNPSVCMAVLLTHAPFLLPPFFFNIAALFLPCYLLPLL